MTITYKQIYGNTNETSEEAVSYCLYNSPKFNPKKHIDPFLEFLNFYKGEKDLLLFVDSAFDHSIDLFLSPHIRIFSCKGLYGYTRHLYRYLGCNLPYSWLHHRGTDTPKVSPIQDNLVKIANDWNCSLITAFGNTARMRSVGGACSMRSETGQNFLKWLERSNLLVGGEEKNWWADETLLSMWEEDHPVPAVYHIFQHLVARPVQEFLLDRMHTGPRTIIVNTSGKLS